MVLAALLASAIAASVPRASSQTLWDIWPTARAVQTPAPCLRPADVAAALQALAAAHPGRLALEEVGRSFEGRPIHLLTAGRGPRRVLLWSQMHGDEPSATPALLDVARYLATKTGDPVIRTIRDELTILMVPMLNPDGAERYQRRNAQEIAVNRDALSPGWRDRLGARPLLPALATRLAVGAPASLVQLRLGPSGALDPDDTRLERAWIDGRVAP